MHHAAVAVPVSGVDTMTSEHEWQYDCQGNQGIIVDSEGYTVARVSVLLDSSDAADFEACIRMMAAAPRLLAALQSIADENPKHKHARIALAAIQRAVI